METLKDIKQTAITSIEDIWATLPKEIFQKNNLKATRTLLIPIVVCVIGYLSIAFLPWYLLPVGWLTVGLAAAGFFSVALSCSQQLLFSSKIINEIIGEVFLIPLMYPFAAWKQQHFGSANKIIKGRFWWLSSAWEWVVSTFNFGRLRASPRVAASFICLYTFAFIFFPLMAYFGGVWGLFKYYIIPYAIYHIWLSSFLKSKYNKVLDFNATRNWLEFLTNDLSFVMNSVSELSSQIPTYNLREAYQYIQEWYDKQGEAQSSFSEYEIILKSGSKIVLKKKIYSRSQAYKQLWTFLSKINWPTTIFLIVVPGMAVYGLLTIEWQVPTFIFALVWYCCGGLSITAGYHRLFSHRAYEAAWPVRLFFALFGAGACEMSVFNWCADHRIHHRYTDTDKDPYSSAKGFFWAHIGWLMTKRDPVVNQARSMSDISDLKQDPILQLQHKFYLPLCLSMAFAVPTLIAGTFWGDWKGGFFISGCLTTSLIQHSTFCVNSVAHFFGDLTYSDQRTPRDAFWVSLLTFGEGYHNFHHEFPYDYRNGIHFYAWDPSKWLVRVLEFVGLAWDLKTFPAEVILKGRLQMEQKALDRKKAKVDWGPPENSLPFWTREEFQQRVSKGDKLMIVDGFVHNVENFLEEHPAGSKIMKPFLGQDISKAFNGGVYNHSNAARNILCTLRVARLFDKKQL